MRLSVLVALAALTITTPARAQETTGDWDVVENPDQNLIAATVTFSSGISLALRCLDGRYDALVGGLPEASPGTEFRPVSLQFGDETADERDWFVARTPGVAISDLPARLARRLREGGVVKLRVQEAGEGGRRLRYDLDLPASAMQIDRTLRACDRPTVDPRDDQVVEVGENGLPGGFQWARQPEVRYPDERTFERGFAVVSCLNNPDGRLRDCLVESEYPLSGGFGEEALRATRRARVERADDPSAEMPTRMITYRTIFRMESEGEAAIRVRSPTRLPDRPPADR